VALATSTSIVNTVPRAFVRSRRILPVERGKLTV
jgi:hypothetical protein